MSESKHKKSSSSRSRSPAGTGDKSKRRSSSHDKDKVKDKDKDKSKRHSTHSTHDDESKSKPHHHHHRSSSSNSHHGKSSSHSSHDDGGSSSSSKHHSSHRGEHDASVPNSSVNVKEDVHQLLLMAKQRAKNLTNAYSIQASRHVWVPSSMYPDLRCFSPQSSSDTEVQAFNTSFLPPMRLVTADSIAEWLIDAATPLNRRSVAVYLSGRVNSSPVVLETLSNKICLSPLATSLTDALKLFLPTTGALDLLLEPATSSSEVVSAQARVLLLAFARSWMMHCRSPFVTAGEVDVPAAGLPHPHQHPAGTDATTTAAIPSTLQQKTKSPSAASKQPSAASQIFLDPTTLFTYNVQTLSTIAAAVLNLAVQQCLDELPQTEIFSQYQSALKNASRGLGFGNAPVNEGDGTSMKGTELELLQTEPFLGRSFAPLLRSPLPSYLFGDILLQSSGRYRFTRDAPSIACYLVLTHDALYFFDTAIYNSAAKFAATDKATNASTRFVTPLGNRFPMLALPLQQCNVRLDGERHCIELTCCAGCDVTLLAFALPADVDVADGDGKTGKTGTTGKGGEMWVVRDVNYHPTVLLEIVSNDPAKVDLAASIGVLPMPGSSAAFASSIAGLTSESAADLVDSEVGADAAQLHAWLDGLERQATHCREENE